MCIYTHTHICEHKYLFIYLFIPLQKRVITVKLSSLSGHKIPIIVSNLMVHHSVHQIASPAHTTCQINPVHALQSYFLLINFSITLSSTLWSSMSSPSFRFSHQNLACIFLPSHAWYKPHPSHPEFKY